MKKNKKIFGIVALAVIIIFGMVSCVLIADDDDKDKDGPTHYAETLVISKEDVWMHNRKTTKISELYYRFLDRSEIGVFGFMPARILSAPPDFGQGNFVLVWLNNLGTIKNGILSCKAPVPTSLLAWEDLVYMFFHEWFLLGPAPHISIDVPVNGNIITLGTTNNKLLTKERFFSTNSSVSQESMRFIYVDADCKITLQSGTGNWDSEYTFSLAPSVLNLKKGWNTLLWTETLDSKSEIAGISIEVRNSGKIRWAIDDPR